MTSDGERAATTRMREAGVPELAVSVFRRFHGMLRSQATGTVHEADVDPLTDVEHLDRVRPAAAEASEALARTVVVKLNGGLGTSMGIAGPKSALPVRDGLTFLDIMARQVLALRRRHGVGTPLLLMNSFRTQEESLRGLAAYPDLAVDGLPLDFVQNKEPKLRVDDLGPVDWPDDPELEWCPPGHGDVYVALQTSGLLDALRERGYRHAFLSNADNLGATCDGAVPAWMARDGIPYVTEVCARTRNDRKGGHLVVRRSDGRLVLRDSAMVAEGEDHFFQDTERHPWFHANNLWVDLDALAARLAERDGDLGLPIIVNRKTVDPTRADSTPGHPGRVGDGCGRRGVRGVTGARGRPQQVPPGQDDQRAAPAALRRLPADRRLPRRVDDRPRGAVHRPLVAVQVRRRLRGALPDRACRPCATARACASRPTRRSVPGSCARATSG